MKYLFLDIDGVLNHEDWYKNKIDQYRNDFKEWWEACFDPECVARVNHILDVTGARLVVSSSWRIDHSLKRYFERFCLPTDFDITPSIRRKDGSWPTRGQEIEVFLQEHPCDNYAIVDDDMDFTDEQLNYHFVHCCADYLSALQEGHEGETGLTERKMNELINKLK